MKNKNHKEDRSQTAQQLYAKFGPVVLKIIKRYVPRNRWMNEVDDLFQETWLRYFQEFPIGGPGPEFPDRWFTTVILNLVRDRNRRFRERELTDGQRVKGRQTNLRIRIFDAMLELIHDELSEKEWVLLCSFYLAGQSVKQIAAQQDVKTNTIFMRLSRVRNRIRKRFPREVDLFQKALETSDLEVLAIQAQQ